MKSQEKIEPVKWSFLNFNFNGQNFAECKKSLFYVNFQYMLNLYRVLFCTGIDLDDIMAYKYFVFYRFYWLVTTFGIV